MSWLLRLREQSNAVPVLSSVSSTPLPPRENSIPRISNDRGEKQKTTGIFIFQQVQQLFEIQKSDFDLLNFDDQFLTSRTIVSTSPSPSLIADGSST